MGNSEEKKKPFVGPVEKLIDCISGAIGKAYEPKHLKKLAEARSYEINTISEAMRENSDIPISYDNNGIQLDTRQSDDLFMRAKNRLAFQELKKQENIEKVAGKAAALLDGEKEVPNTPMDSDWTIRFFNSVEDVSSEEMQNLWARVLAGEVKQPGSFALRTLETLHNMTKSEAEVFNEICHHVLITDGKMIIFNDNAMMKTRGILYGYIIQMEECGLMNSDNQVAVTSTIDNSLRMIARNDSMILFGRTKTDTITEIKMPAYILTIAGSELARIIGVSTPDEELMSVAREIQKRNPQVYVSAHKINSIEAGGEINYCMTDQITGRNISGDI